MRLFLLLVILSNFLLLADSSASSLYDNFTPVQKDYWLKLLHFKNGKSRAASEKYFFSESGKINPSLELDATLLAFKNPNGTSGWFNYHPQCVFRERLNFLKKAGLLNDLKEKSCPEFDDWKKGLNADSLTLVFSSSYPNNPSSLFGHTLIRLNQKNKTSDLLDYSVAYSALANNDDIGIVYAYKGLFGGYKGLLEVTKYYIKVTEYNNGESRDLIEYDLNMTTDELDRLINHLWEIYQTTYFNYYFIDENCSSVLMDILAVPFNHDKINSHKRWYYLPSEVIKTFKNIPGRIKSVNFRASLKKQFEKNYSALSKIQQDEVRVLARATDLSKNPISIPVLDGVIGLLDYKRYRTKDNLSADEKLIFRKALIARSAMAQEVETKPYIYPQNNRPDLGHEPQKFSFFTRTENAHSLLGIEIKEGYHDLMGLDEGYDPFSQFDFLTASLVYDKKLNRVTYDQLTLINLTSLHPYKFYDPQFSWSAKIMSNRLYDIDCVLCHKLDARAYIGPAFRPTSNMAVALLGGAFAEASKLLSHGLRLGVGFEGSLLFQVTNKIKLGLFDEMRFDGTQKIKKDYYNNLSFKQSYFSTTNSEWRLESSLVSSFGSLKTKTKIFQFNYGQYF